MIRLPSLIIALFLVSAITVESAPNGALTKNSAVVRDSPKLRAKIVRRMEEEIAEEVEEEVEEAMEEAMEEYEEEIAEEVEEEVYGEVQYYEEEAEEEVEEEVKYYEEEAEEEVEEEVQYYEEEAEEEVEEEVQYYEEEAEEEVEEEVQYYEEEAEEEVEEEVQYYEEEAEEYYEYSNSTSTSGTDYKQKAKDYQTQFTNKINNDYLPDGYYITEGQFLGGVIAFIALFAATIVCACKAGNGSQEGDYVREDLIKNEHGVTA